MKLKWVIPLLLLLAPGAMSASAYSAEKLIGLNEIRTLIRQNRSIIVEQLKRNRVYENLRQQKIARLPDIQLNGDGYYENSHPLHSEVKADNSLLYHFNIYSEIDVYTGGKHRYAIERMKQEHQMSEERLQAIEDEVELQAYVLLYDIHRNIKYKDFIRHSIILREKEYDRINQLYKNGLILKSDLLRSKLYITDLQKDEVSIENSIEILSDKLCVLLGMKERYSIRPQLEEDLHYQLKESFEDLYQTALAHSPMLKMKRMSKQKEETALKEIRSKCIPHLKLFADYGVGAAKPTFDFKHQTGGQIGAKMTFSISSFYKTRHEHKAQKHLIEREQIEYENDTENMRTALYEIFTRYNESLLNIERALEKIDMSKESTRILNNSYFNQQALLIDVLESQTKAMEASFEWVEAVVDSQKYYWALKQLCGIL